MYEIDDLIAKNTGLAYAQLLKFGLIDDQEAESIALWALYRALSTYNVNKGYTIGTYATCCIYNALGDYVRRLKRKRALNVVSYNAEVLDNVEYLSTMKSEDDTENEYIRAERNAMLYKILDEVYDGMKNEKHKVIFKLYREGEFNVPLADIASGAGVSNSYVSRTLAEIRFIIKQKLGGLNEY